MSSFLKNSKNLNESDPSLVVYKNITLKTNYPKNEKKVNSNKFIFGSSRSIEKESKNIVRRISLSDYKKSQDFNFDNFQNKVDFFAFSNDGRNRSNFNINKISHSDRNLISFPNFYNLKKTKINTSNIINSTKIINIYQNRDEDFFLKRDQKERYNNNFEKERYFNNYEKEGYNKNQNNEKEEYNKNQKSYNINNQNYEKEGYNKSQNNEKEEYNKNQKSYNINNQNYEKEGYNKIQNKERKNQNQNNEKETNNKNQNYEKEGYYINNQKAYNINNQNNEKQGYNKNSNYEKEANNKNQIYQKEAYNINNKNNDKERYNIQNFNYEKKLNFPSGKRVLKKYGPIEFLTANSYKGLKSKNEDRISISFNMQKLLTKKDPLINHISIISIFDGHGGEETCNFLKHNLHLNLIKNISEKKSITNSIKKCYKEIDRSIYDNIKDNSGSCGVTVFFLNDLVFVINLGDSRAIASFEKGKYFRDITQDHKPSTFTEFERIRARKGKIYCNSNIDQKRYFAEDFYQVKKTEEMRKKGGFGPWRIFPGGLSVSRSFGDFHIKNQRVEDSRHFCYNIPDNEPDVFQVDVNNMDFLVLACKLIS